MSTKVENLAQEVLQLAKTHETTSKDTTFGTQPPLLIKAEELIQAASGPADHATTLVRTLVETAVIRSLIHTKILVNIPIDNSISLKELSTKTGVQDTFLQRLLRVVVGSGFLTQHQDGTYAHTPSSAGYRDEIEAFVCHTYDMTILPLLNLPKYLDARGTNEPSSFTHNPLTYFVGQEGKTPFEIMAQQPAKMQQLHRMMVIAEKFRPYTGFYDYSQLIDPADPDRIVFVDVGGGNGHVIQNIMAAHHDIRPQQCVLQDREEVVNLAREQGKLRAGVQMMAHDFFTEQPVKNARAYHLRAVAHDLSDGDVVRLLGEVVKAMGSDSKVLIADCIVPERGAKGDLVDMMDMMMMTIGGKERTEENFQRVLESAGLQLDRIYRADVHGWGIVEASLKK